MTKLKIMPHAVGAYLKGVGVESVELDANNHLIVHLDNGETVDAGEFKVDDELNPNSSRPLANKTLSSLFSAVDERINTLVGGNATEAIDNLNEIIAFLQNFKDSETLASILAEINEELQKKVDKVEGYGLSECNYSTEDREAVASVKNGTVVTDNTSQSIVAGDVKPVSGGAVSEALDAVNNYLGKHYGKEILTTVGYIHALQDVSVGSTLPTSMENIPSKSTGKIKVKAGQKVNLSTYITSGNAGYARAYYAVDNEGIIRQIAPSENLTDYSSGITITIEADGYLYIVCNNDHADVVSIDIVGGIDAKFEKILKRFDGEMVDLTYSYGFYYLSDSRVGDTFPAAVWESATKFCGRVDISSTSKIKLSTYVTSATAGAARPWCLVDAQGVILDMAPSINTYDYQNGIVLDTEGAEYLYFCSDADYISALSVEFIGLAQESSLLDEEIATSKQTNTPPIYLPHKTVMLSGASINQYNGYFEYAMRKMGLSGTNVSIAGYNILHLCHLLYTNSYEDIDLLILSHTHNFDVFTLPPSVIEYTVEEYEADAILAPYLTTGTYVGGFITPPDAYTVDEMYAIGYDYAIKKWVSKCYALRTNSSYDSLAGKLPQIMLYTYWHDGNKVFNKAIRKLAKKWNIPLIKDDENIGFTSERLHPVTKQQWSILYCNGVPWPATNVVDGITYGQHPSGIAQSDWDAFCAADAETMLSMLPDIQVKRASILMKMLSNCIM